MTPKISLIAIKQAALLPLLLLALAAALAACSGGNGAASATPDSAPPTAAQNPAATTPPPAAAGLVAVSNEAAAPAPTSATAQPVAGQQTTPAAPPAPQPTAAAQPNPPPATLSPGQIVAAWEQTLTGVYHDVLPSVVYIRVRSGRSFPDGLQERLPDEFDEFLWGQGSGFVWDAQGHIVTNHHVIQDADQVTVYFSDSASVQAEVIGADPYSDLAVIKIDPADANMAAADLNARSLRPATLGDSDDVRPGQIAVAIGAPFGQEFSMTSGIISAVGRMVSGSSQFSIPEVIQTDAAVNPGNSGGPLLDRQGRVIGINTSILTNTGVSSGVGMAVPVNIARRVIPSLIADGEFKYSWLGVRISTVDAAYARLAGLPPAARGALISEVVPGSPAAQAGLRPSDSTLTAPDTQEYPAGGDIITAVNDHEIAGTKDLIAYLTYSTSPGDTVTFTILRNGQPEQIQATLAQRPAPTE